MKKFGNLQVIFSVCIFSIFLFTPSFATVYYVDSSRPHDSGGGTSEGTAWKTIGKVNSVNFSDNDTIKFKRGGKWTDATLTLYKTSAGRSGITIEDYGTGNKPLIDGNYIKPINIAHALVNLTIKNIDISGWNAVKDDRADFYGLKGLTIDGLVFNGHANGSDFAGIGQLPYAAQVSYNVLNINDVDGNITVKNCTISNLLKQKGFAASISAWGKNDIEFLRIAYTKNCNGKTTGVININDNNISNVYSDQMALHGLQCKTNIYNNQAVGFGENFIDAKGSRYFKIYNNLIRGGNIGKDPGVGYFGPNTVVFHLPPDFPCQNLPIGSHEIFRNQISDIYGDGLYITGGNNKVHDNYIYNALIGIRVGGDRTEVYDNTIIITPNVRQDPDNHYNTAAYRSGILLDGSYNSKVLRNTIVVQNKLPSNGITVIGNSSGGVYEENKIHVTNSEDFCFFWDGKGSTPKLINNIYYNPDTNIRMKWGGQNISTNNIYQKDSGALTGAFQYNMSNFSLAAPSNLKVIK